MKLRFAAIALSATLVACGGGSGSGDVAGDNDIDGVPVIGGGDDVDFNGEDDLGLTDEDDLVDVDDTFADGCEGGSGTDLDSSTAQWDDNCRLQRFGEHANSSYTQGMQRIIFCRGHNAGLSDLEINSFADGAFGPTTQEEVRNFQTAEGILADGIIGPETWGALRDVLEFLAPNEANTADVHGVLPGTCANVRQFEQDQITGGWAMSRTPGSPETVSFSVDPPVAVQ